MTAAIFQGHTGGAVTGTPNQVLLTADGGVPGYTYRLAGGRLTATSRER
jgi:hypothetical protein